MTPLANLPGHELWFECAAGHARPVSVAALLALPNPPATDKDALKQAVCSVCGGKAVDCRIVWVGAPNNDTPR